jgi:hypothetical protein
MKNNPGTPFTLSPSQEQEFVLTGKIPPTTKDSNPTDSSLLLSAAQGDPDALKALQLKSRLDVQTHNGYANSSLDRMSAGQQRALKADAQWSNINRRMGALTTQYSKVATYDPDTAQGLSGQIDALANQAEARKAQVLGGKSAGNNQPAPAQQTFSHLSASGKYGWNGTSWVATGK